MPENGGRVQPVRIEFRDDRTPWSPLFGDVYFSPASGIEESLYVYLEGSGLRGRLSKLSSGDLTVAEIGFGVGLNFLLTLREFRRSAAAGIRLHYFSFEKHPVLRADLERLYSAYPELAAEAGELLRSYPLLTPGIHRIPFLGGRVFLYLALGDVRDLLPRSDFSADHWFWDGFAPGKNPEAFSEEIFRECAGRSNPGAEGASFSSAGWVRRGLETAGFLVSKRPGFGKKRECIRASWPGKAPPRERTPPWFSGKHLKRLHPGQRVAILGAGLAGSAAALALRDSGVETVLFDPNGAASRASGNPLGLFNVQISRIPNPMSRFHQAALAHFLGEIARLEIPVHRGILRTDVSDPSALERSDWPEDFYRMGPRGLELPHCGILNPQALCRRRIAESGACLRSLRVEKREREGDRFRLLLSDHSDAGLFDHLIHATGADGKGPLPGEALGGTSGDFPLLLRLHETLPTRAIRGQIVLLPPTAESRMLGSTLVQEGYATPLAPDLMDGKELHLLGATYQAKAVAPDQEALDTAALLQDAAKWPEFETHSKAQVHSIRAGFRLSTPDKLPLIGPLCDPSELARVYGNSFRGGASGPGSLPSLPMSPGEWLLSGFGSRGIISSSLSAEVLISAMRGAPLPLELDLWEHLHSARFFLRNLRKPALR